METLHRAGVKPVWVDRAGRIKHMHAALRRRAEGGFRVFFGRSDLSCPVSSPPTTPQPPPTKLTPTAEWARILLDEASSSPSPPTTIPPARLPRLRDQWRARLEGLRSLENDLAFVNAEIDLYNLQVRQWN